MQALMHEVALCALLYHKVRVLSYHSLLHGHTHTHTYDVFKA